MLRDRRLRQGLEEEDVEGVGTAEEEGTGSFWARRWIGRAGARQRYAPLTPIPAPRRVCPWPQRSSPFSRQRSGRAAGRPLLRTTRGPASERGASGAVERPGSRGVGGLELQVVRAAVALRVVHDRARV